MTGPTFLKRYRARRDARPDLPSSPDDEGFTLIELTVTLVVLGIVFGLVMGLIIGLQQQQVNLLATVNGSHQEQIANQAVVQYLRAAATPATTYCPPSPAVCLTAQSLTLPVYIGSQTGTDNYDTDAVTMKFTPGAGGSYGTGTLQVVFKDLTTNTSRTLGTYYALGDSTSTIFTYYGYQAGGDGTLQQLAAPVPACAYYEIAAVKVDLSFFAGPGDLPTRGYAADISTTLDTTIFLRNSLAFQGSTTTSSTVTTCPE